jgi:hypothetical protein
MAYHDVLVTKDVHGDQAVPNTNQGGSTALQIGKASSYNNTTVLYPSLEAFAGLKIKKVELIMYQTAIGNANQLNFSANCITEDWEEDEVTYNNLPAYSATAAVNLSISTNTAAWRYFDITTLIQDILYNSRTYKGILLRQTDATTSVVKQFGSREYGAAPRLRITLDGTIRYAADDVHKECLMYLAVDGTHKLVKPYYGAGDAYIEIGEL